MQKGVNSSLETSNKKKKIIKWKTVQMADRRCEAVSVDEEVLTAIIITNLQFRDADFVLSRVCECDVTGTPSREYDFGSRPSSMANCVSHQFLNEQYM